MQRARGTDRILDILECFARLGRPASRPEVAQRLHMPRSTVYALCDLLLQREWLVERAGLLSLGPQAGFISTTYLRNGSFEPLARDLLVRLAAETRTLTEINVIDGWKHVVALSAGEIGQGYIRPLEGARLPLIPTAAARILLAGVPEARVMAQFSDADLKDVTGRPITRAAFFDDIADSTTRGHASVTGWFDGTLSTLAVPVTDGAGRVLASLCMILPTADMVAERGFYLDHLRDGAAELSAILAALPWPYGERCWQEVHDAPAPHPAGATSPAP